MIRKGLTDILGNEIYYEIHGKGIPVLLIHGWSVDHRLMKGCMEPVFKKKRGFQRIYLDLPGMGKSKQNGKIKNSDDMLKVITTFIDRFIPGKKFLLAGESYGGHLSRGLLLERSQSVLGLMLICSLIIPGFRKGNIPPLTVIEKDQKFLDRLSKEELDSFTYMNVVLTGKVWKQYRKDIYGALRIYDKDFLDHVLDGAFSFDINKENISFDKPSLILSGRQDTEVGFRDQIEKFIDFSRATIAVLDKAGHNLQIEQNILFQALVSEWLDRVKLYFKP